MTAEKDLIEMSEIELLQAHGAIIDELLRRGVVETRNNPIGDYTEWLVRCRLGLTKAAKNEKGFDAIDADRIRYQIKGRRDDGNVVQFSAIRNLDAQDFDIVIAVVFNNDYSIRLAVAIPHDVVPEFASYQRHTNAHNLILSESVLRRDGVVDIRQFLV